MQGKGAGPVNRVELESQVLCAALRQSCHLKDRIGAFTSVRELSHLFPDLLPPPEKHDDVSESNKANYYSVLGVRPQTSANGVISAYLRAVRAFLRRHKVQDSRVEYNRILNAGFILRKPRLRLSHDLVVARRWLHEESRLAQMAHQEVTLDRDEALRVIRPTLQPAASVTTPAPEQATPAMSPPTPLATAFSTLTTGDMPTIKDPSGPGPQPAIQPAVSLPVAAETAQPAPAAASRALDPRVAANPSIVDPVTPPPPVPAEPPVALPPPPVLTPHPVHASVDSSRVSNVPPVPAFPEISSGRDGGDSGFATPQPKHVEVPPVPPLPVHAASAPHVVPPVPTIVNEYWEKQQNQPAASAEPATDATPVTAFPMIANASSPPLAVAEVANRSAVEPAVAAEIAAYAAAEVNAHQIDAPPPTGARAIAPPSSSIADLSYGGEIEIAPGFFVPASSPSEAGMPPFADEAASVTSAPQVESPDAFPAVANAVSPDSFAPPAVAQAPHPDSFAPKAAPVPPVMAQSHGDNGSHEPPSDAGFPPAAVRAQAAPQPAPSTQSAERPPGRISKQATFVFDESALHRPAPLPKAVPMLIQLLEAAQFITGVEVQALIAQMEFAPNVPIEKLILNAGYVTPQEMASCKLGESLLQQGKIAMAQFQVAIYDERTSGLRMAESLQVRGWLSVEVRNAIDEFHRKRT